MKKIVIVFMCVFAFSINARADLNDGLVAHLFVNDASDATSNGHNGIVYGGASPCIGVDEKEGSAYSLDGVDDYIKIPHHADLNFEGDFSISFWAKRDGTVGDRVFMAKGRDCANGMFFGHSGPQNFHLSYPDRWCHADGVAKSFPTNEWHHVAVVVDIINLKLYYYLDGVKVSETDIEPFRITNTYPLVIGRHFTNADGSGGYQYYWAGDVDELRLYNRALSKEEIVELCNFGNVEPEIDIELNNSVQNQKLTSVDDFNLYKFTLTEDTTVALLSTGSLDLKGELFQKIDNELVPIDANEDGVADEDDRRVSNEFIDATKKTHKNFMLRPGFDQQNLSDETIYDRILPADEYYLKVSLNEGAEEFNLPFGVLLLKKTEATKIADFFDGVEALINDEDINNNYLDIYVQAVFAWIYENANNGNWSNCFDVTYKNAAGESYVVPGGRQCKAVPNFYVRYLWGSKYLLTDCAIQKHIAKNQPNKVLRAEETKTTTTIYNVAASPVLEDTEAGIQQGDVWVSKICLVCKGSKWKSGYNHYGLQFDADQIVDANYDNHGTLRIADNASVVRTKIVRPE